MGTAEDRKKKAEDKSKEQMTLRKKAQGLKDKGYTNVAIAAEMNLSESTIRRLVK